MDDFSIWQDSRVDQFVQQSDENSVSASFIMRLIDSSISLTITKTAPFIDVDGVMLADVTLEASDTGVVGVYEYQILENFDSEDPLYYPSTEECDDECELPTVTICESITGGDIS